MHDPLHGKFTEYYIYEPVRLVRNIAPSNGIRVRIEMADDEKLQKELDQKDGVLKLSPNIVLEEYPGLDRLGVRNSRPGNRGYLSERWIASCIKLSSAPKSSRMGLSSISLGSSGHEMLLSDAFEFSPGRILGKSYANVNRKRLGLALGILDVGYPIFHHVHPTKDESYFFLQHKSALGPTPYSHLGLHPGTGDSQMLDCLKRWNDDKVLDLSPAYRLNVGEGFLTPAGVPHAPGTAITLELAEPMDDNIIIQAEYMGKILPKRRFLLRNLPDEKSVNKLINFKVASDPHYYRKFHLTPQLVSKPPEGRCSERWIYSPRTSRKYSGKELVVEPSAKVRCKERAAHPLLIWQGRGRIQRTPVRAQLGQDEVFITKEAADSGYLVENTGSTKLVAYKTFGPNVYTKT
jgi:hypothetical protein